MFKETNKIGDIWLPPLFVANSLYLISFKDKKLVEYKNQNTLDIINAFECYVIESWNQGLIVNENYFFDIQKNKGNFLFHNNQNYLNKIKKHLTIDSTLILAKIIDESNESVKFGKYFYKEEKLELFEKNVSIPRKSLGNSSFLSQKGAMLICHFLYDGAELWSVDLPSPIEGEIIDYKNLIIVTSKDQVLHAFDISTGNKAWEISDVYGFNLFLDKNAIYQLAGDSFKMIDASSGGIIFSKNLEQENKKENIFFQVGNENVFDGKHIYFCSELSPKIGAFNIETAKVDWLYEFEKPQGLTKDYFLKRPQIHGEKLYVLDSNNTLHIFERENG